MLTPGELAALQLLLQNSQQAAAIAMRAQEAYQSYAALLEAKYGKKNHDVVIDPTTGVVEYEKPEA